MPTEYKIFLGKGALPPYNPRQGASPLDLCERSQTILPTVQNGMTPMHRCEQRGGGGAPAPIFVDIRGKRATRGNVKWDEVWNLWWKWYKLRNHYELMRILPSEKGFLGLLKH